MICLIIGIALLAGRLGFEMGFQIAKAERERDDYRRRMEASHGNHPVCGCDCAGCLGMIEDFQMWKVNQAALAEETKK